MSAAILVLPDDDAHSPDGLLAVTSLEATQLPKMQRVETTIEVGGWEHECCGPAFERNQVVDLRCFRLVNSSERAARLIETHHELDASHEHVTVRGRVVDISILHADGSIELVKRLPSGEALRGFDEHDDGHLEKLWTGEHVTADSDTFLIRIVS